MVKKITFKNLSDFKSRIAHLWQNQKENEIFEFEFLDKETENEFMKLEKAFGVVNEM